MAKFINDLPETNHEETARKEELKQRCNALGLHYKTTTEEDLIRRESR